MTAPGDFLYPGGGGWNEPVERPGLAPVRPGTGLGGPDVGGAQPGGLPPNAYMVLLDMLRQWGLESLGPKVLEFLQNGYTESEIPVLLQDTDEYKARFAGNEARRKAGLSVLAPKEYLKTEETYRQIMYNAGLPPGFYDSPDDFAGFIGRDVAPVEVQRRVDEAYDAVFKTDEFTKGVWRGMGIGDADMLAWALDQQRGRDELNKVLRGGRIAGAALGAGVQMSAAQRERAGLMAGEDYVQRAGEFATLAGAGQKLSALYEGDDYGADEAVDEIFGLSAAARRKRERLFNVEEATFAGSGGAARTGLGQTSGGF